MPIMSGIQSAVWLVAYVHMAISPISQMVVKPTMPTIIESLRENHEVVQAFVCSSPYDIECIDDVCNDREAHKYWTIEVNGDYVHYNSMSRIKPTEKVVLKYSSLPEEK